MQNEQWPGIKDKLLYGTELYVRSMTSSAVFRFSCPSVKIFKHRSTGSTLLSAFVRRVHKKQINDLDHGAGLHVGELLHAPLSLDDGADLKRQVGVLVLLSNLIKKKIWMKEHKSTYE